MHISDGMLTPLWSIIWYIIALVFIAYGVLKIKKRTKENTAYMPMLALMGAAVFVISVWHIPVPVTGSSSHPVGTPMSAIIVGPYATVVISIIALFFQMFLGHGGLTTIGANTVSMGIVGTFSGYIVYKILTLMKAPLWLSAGMAGFVGDMLTYATTSYELALSLFPNSVMSHLAIFMIGFAPTQIPLAVAEFVFTAMIVRYIAEQRPDILIKLQRGEISEQNAY